jgi:hypothetical protein
MLASLKRRGSSFSVGTHVERMGVVKDLMIRPRRGGESPAFRKLSNTTKKGVNK